MDKFILPEYDGYFFMDYLLKKDSGFSYDIFISMDDGINEAPYVLCRRKDPMFSDAIVVTNEDCPKILQGDFANAKEQEEIFQFVRENKNTILEYWNKELSTFDFLDKVLVRGEHI